MYLRDFHLFSFLSGRVLFLVRVVIGTFTFELLDLQTKGARQRSSRPTDTMALTSWRFFF